MNSLSRLQPAPVVFPLACVGALAMILISEVSYWRSVATLEALGSPGSVRSSIRLLQQRNVNAECSQHGYALTGRAESR